MQSAAAIADGVRAERSRGLATTIRVRHCDLELAQEAVQDAFEAALARWPSEGMPAEPRGWLVSVARHKAIDQVRRRVRLRELVAAEEPPPDALDHAELGAVPDDRLRLIFT